MTPRNIRKIPVYKLKEILHIFISTERKYGWAGQQENQDKFIIQLNEIGFKRDNSSYSPNPGGARTYEAQLRNLGLIYPTGSHPEFDVTIAGQEVLSGANPLDAIHHILLSNQYPSDYSKGRNIRIHPDIKIKPFLFLAKLCKDKELGGLTVVEMMYACIYGHNWQCCDLVKDKILSFRNNNIFLKQIDNPAEDYYTTRAIKTDNESRFIDIKDIANTFKNCLESNYLLVKKEEDRFVFNEEYSDIYKRHYDEHDRFIELSNPMNFQRTYGSWNRKKDTRATPSADNIDKKNFDRDRAAELTAQYFSNYLVSDYPDTLDRDLHECGFSRQIIDKVITNALKDSMDYFSAHFIELSVSPSEHRAFELALNDLITKAGISSKHTGQLRVPGIGGCADVLSFSDMRKESIQFDTKAKKDSNYSLPAGDYRALKSYYEGHNKVLEQLSLSVALVCCAQVVVSSGFSSNAGQTFETLSKEISNPVSGITALQILRLLKEVKSVSSPEKKNKKFFNHFSQTTGRYE
jgi:hypothetical protein